MKGFLVRFSYAVVAIVLSVSLTSTAVLAQIPAWSTDDAWYASVAETGMQGPSCVYDQYNYCLRNCTSYTAQRLAADGVRPSDFKGLGNGGDWYRNAVARGLSVGSTPKVGAVAVSESINHVGYVEKVHSDGSVAVKSYSGTRQVPWNENRATRYSKFIYFSSSTGISNGPGSWKGVGRAVYKGTQLSPGQTLRTGEYLASSNLKFALVMQNDGNLVLYHSGRAIWDSKTAGKNANRVVLQGDGNLVMYQVGGTAVWHTKTRGSGANRAVLQPDGNFVMYAGGSPKWHTRTSGHETNAYFGSDRLRRGQTLRANQYLRSGDGRYALLLQKDGNLVIYSAGYNVLWSSKTKGSGAERLVMQGDGNLVLYDGGTPRWHTQTHGAGDRAIMQSDGNFVLYAGGSARWNSATAGKI